MDEYMDVKKPSLETLYYLLPSDKSVFLPYRPPVCLEVSNSTSSSQKTVFLILLKILNLDDETSSS